MEIDKLISSAKYEEAIEECVRTNNNNLGILLGYICNSDKFNTQFNKNIKGVNSEGKIICEIDQRECTVNPPLL